MSLVQLGDRLADWDARTPLVFPWVDVKEDKGYLFFLGQPSPKKETKNQYLLVLPEIRARRETYQTSLDCKYFPGLTTMVFSVVVPKTDLFKDPEVRIVLLPREFKKGTALEKTLEINLAYDDKELGDISFPFV